MRRAPTTDCVTCHFTVPQRPVNCSWKIQGDTPPFTVPPCESMERRPDCRHASASLCDQKGDASRLGACPRAAGPAQAPHGFRGVTETGDSHESESRILYEIKKGGLGSPHQTPEAAPSAAWRGDGTERVSTAKVSHQQGPEGCRCAVRYRLSGLKQLQRDFSRAPVDSADPEGAVVVTALGRKATRHLHN